MGIARKYQIMKKVSNDEKFYAVGKSHVGELW